MLVETKARVGVFAIALGAYLPQFPTPQATSSAPRTLIWSFCSC
ncbi:Uncharacterised protein [Alistipes sp. cv1]|nr:Uncharacterised protein [Faecalibacterium prausnitzii]